MEAQTTGQAREFHPSRGKLEKTEGMEDLDPHPSGIGEYPL